MPDTPRFALGLIETNALLNHSIKLIILMLMNLKESLVLNFKVRRAWMLEESKESGFYYFLSKFLILILRFLSYLLQEIHINQIIKAKLTPII